VPLEQTMWSARYSTPIGVTVVAAAAILQNPLLLLEPSGAFAQSSHKKRELALVSSERVREQRETNLRAKREKKYKQDFAKCDARQGSVRLWPLGVDLERESFRCESIAPGSPMQCGRQWAQRVRAAPSSKASTRFLTIPCARDRVRSSFV